MQEVQPNHYIYGQDGRVQQFAFIPQDVPEEEVSDALPLWSWGPGEAYYLVRLSTDELSCGIILTCCMCGWYQGTASRLLQAVNGLSLSQVCSVRNVAIAAGAVLSRLYGRRWQSQLLGAALHRRQVALQRLQPWMPLGW